MENLLNVLQVIIEKYGVADEDIAMIQEALTALETGGESEFGYEEDISEEPVEE